jgi:phage FluMu protein Com
VGALRCPKCGLLMVKEDKNKCPRCVNQRKPIRDSTVHGIMHTGGPRTSAKFTNSRSKISTEEIAEQGVQQLGDSDQHSTSSTPDRVGEEMTDMGRSIRHFRADLTELTAGAIIGLLMVAGGVFAFSGYQSTNWESRFLPLIFGGLFCGCGTLFFGWAIITMTQKVVVYENGIMIRNLLRVQTCRWDGVVRACEVIHWVRPPLIKGPLKYAIPKSRNRVLILYLRHGRKLRFEPFFKHFDEFVIQMNVEVEKRGIPWESKEKGAHPF